MFSSLTEPPDPSEWSHVGTHENAAHLVSRGIMPGELELSGLWWKGSSFLRKNDVIWPKGFPAIAEDELPELITVVAATTLQRP